MPTPSSEHQQLSKFVGEWNGNETLHPSPYAPEGGPAEGRWIFRVGGGGFFVFGDYQQARDGSVNLEGMGHARYTLTGADRRLTFSIENSPDGKSWTAFLEGDYERAD